MLVYKADYLEKCGHMLFLASRPLSLWFHLSLQCSNATNTTKEREIEALPQPLGEKVD